MQLGTFIRHATQQLTDCGIITARLDVLILLEDALGKDRALLLAHPELELSSETIELLEQQVTRRCAHEPLAYIRGHAAFYGRDFEVSSAVLVPRPETENIITLLKNIDFQSLPDQVKIADVGAGSGCVGITAALEVPNAQVELIDISPEALAIAQRNIQKHGLSERVHTREGNLLETTSTYTIVLANLPYVPDTFPINKAARKEPTLALFSGADGMDHYKIFWQQLGGHAQKPRYVITESFPNQHHFNATLARNAGYTLIAMTDFIQCFSADPAQASGGDANVAKA